LIEGRKSENVEGEGREKGENKQCVDRVNERKQNG
jgi:hypothetical protein